jgi:hypothetical protein
MIGPTPRLKNESRAKIAIGGPRLFRGVNMDSFPEAWLTLQQAKYRISFHQPLWLQLMRSHPAGTDPRSQFECSELCFDRYEIS